MAAEAHPLPKAASMISLFDKWELLRRICADPRRVNGRAQRGCEVEVAFILLNHLNTRTGRCDPSREKIATQLHMSVRAVARALTNLREWGYFRTARQGWHRSSAYSPVFDAPEAGQDVTATSPLEGPPEVTATSRLNGSEVTQPSSIEVTQPSSKHGKKNTVIRFEHGKAASPPAALPLWNESPEGGDPPKPPPAASPSAAASANGSRYAFEGKIIRLTAEHLRQWEDAYSAIPDLRAQLQSDDDYYDRTLTGKDRQRWFFRESQRLNKLHQHHLQDRREDARSASLNDSW
jgi:hypothetical protein